MDFPPFVMVYHKRAKSPFHAEPKQYDKARSYDVLYGKWTYSYGQHLLINQDGTIEMVREDGQSRFFKWDGSEYSGRSGMYIAYIKGNMLGHLEALPGGGYTYISLDGVQETYNKNGFLTQIKNLRGAGTHNITYSMPTFPDSTVGTPVTVTYVERNESISFYTKLYFFHHSNIGMPYIPRAYFPGTLDTPGGEITIYSSRSCPLLINLDYADPYASVEVPLLREIRWPTGEYKKFNYVREGGCYLNIPSPVYCVWYSLLSSIDSFNTANVRTFHAEYEYDDYARATLSAHGQNDLSYKIEVSGYEDGHNHTVTNINGLSTEYTFESYGAGGARLTQVNGNAFGSCLASNAKYYSLDYLDEAITESGLTTDYDFASNQYDFSTIGLLDKMTYKGVDNGTDRVINYDWNSNRQLEQVTQPGLTVGYTYEHGRIASHSETDTTVDPPGYARTHARTRAWSYTYTYHGGDADGLHRVEQLVVTGPRGDQTTYRFSPTGNLTSITDALNYTVTFSAHNEYGLPGSMLDANGLTSTLQYDGRGRLTLLSTSGAETGFAYNPENKLTRVTFPDARYLDFTYSDSGRLSAITNDVGEKIDLQSRANTGFTHDDTKIFGTDGATQHAAMWRQYDALGRLWKMYDLGGARGEINYDASGNPDTIIDGNNGIIKQVFDKLGRLKTITDNRQEDSTTQLDYDNQDRLTAVVDPDGVTTTFHYDGFGNLLQTTSPDTGTTTYQYDDAGNVKTLIQANGATIGYSYDLLNRLAFIDNPNQNNDVTLIYDETTTNGATNYGVGHLTSILQANGNSIKWIYEAHGKIITDIRKIGGSTYTTGYAYDNVGAGKLKTMTYPSGNTYIINTNVSNAVNGNIRAITLQTPSTEIVKNVTYKPFGPATRFAYGNGRVYSATYDSLYRMDALKSGASLNLDYGYDSRSMVDYIYDLTTAASRDEDFDYDPAGRLFLATGDYGYQSYLYSYAGDRGSATSDLNGQSTNDSFITEPGTHLLQEVVGDNPRSFTYNVVGRLFTDNDRTFVYDVNGQVTSVKVGGVAIATYSYNPLRQRHAKTVAGVNRRFVYGLNGELIWEGLNNGSWQRDYVYLHDLLVGFVDTTVSGINVYYVHADRLGTPQIVSNSANVNVWKAQYTPYGQANIKLANIENNIRFPGQYYDAETGLHYNLNRYYDPSTGRYTTPDPIGLVGGINLYAYVQNNPVNFVDPEGLWIPYAIGAGVGLGFEGYNQFQNGELNVGRLFVATATGAFGGFGSTWLAAGFFGAASNMINTAYQQSDGPCNSFDSSTIIRSGEYGFGGGILGGVGGVAGRSIYKPVNIIGGTVGKLPEHHYEKAGAAIGAILGGAFANP